MAHEAVADKTNCDDLFEKIRKCDEKLSKLHDEGEKAKKAHAAKVEAVEQLKESFQRDIVSRATGIPPNDCHLGSYQYGHNPESVPFGKFPQAAAQALRSQVKDAERAVRFTHPVGAQLEALKDRVAYYEDQLLACNQHTALQAIWDELTEELGDFDPDALTKRQPRRVRTDRNGKKQGAEAEGVATG